MQYKSSSITTDAFNHNQQMKQDTDNMIRLLKVICNGNVLIPGYLMFNLCRDAEHTWQLYETETVDVKQLEI